MKDADLNSPAKGVELHRLVRRCAIYNEVHGTEYTPETYDDERSSVPRMIEWDRGWEACEAENSNARELLAEIVAQYDAAPDGPLGKGFTNAPFLRARTFLYSPNASGEGREGETPESN